MDIAALAIESDPLVLALPVRSRVVFGWISHEAGVPHPGALNGCAGRDIYIPADQISPGRHPDDSPCRDAVADGGGIIRGPVARGATARHRPRTWRRREGRGNVFEVN